MIRSNLSVLLAQRSLTVTQVAKETGISRTTLNALEKNYSQGVQLSTINTLCSYLKVTPSDLLKYYPIDIHWKYSFETNDYADGQIVITRNNKSLTFPVTFYTEVTYKYFEEDNPPVCTSAILFINLYQESNENTKYISSVFDELPIEFKSDINSFLLSRFLEHLDDEKHLLVTDETEINIEFEFTKN